MHYVLRISVTTEFIFSNILQIPFHPDKLEAVIAHKVEEGNLKKEQRIVLKNLLEFVPDISSFSNCTKEADGLRFNRASLLNAGFLETSREFDYVALHDVDLIPKNPSLIYSFPSEGPFHVAAPHLHPRYHYPTFIGGILLIQRVDGLSNKYWGWGLEDDEFYARLTEARFKVFRPANLSTGIKDTFKHHHNRRIRKRDMIKCYNQQDVTRRRDRQTGLSTTKYNLLSRMEMTADGHPFTILNIELLCDYAVTPWCNCTQNVGNTKKTKTKQKKSSADIIVPRINIKKHLTVDG
ncbi:Beta-1,4-galactosyltransferase 7 [Armadillidium nasatum]|uniref:Beta-1,4-galactosyltransferase 7 n=1 Tax=Armadillidium nasatum TaxID=96803 RepID=A0A5N5T6P0_9CRUS|nr:Beta-1,4-galactosyltransferase 7 [Armadillidium nasatum]